MDKGGKELFDDLNIYMHTHVHLYIATFLNRP